MRNSMVRGNSKVMSMEPITLHDLDEIRVIQAYRRQSGIMQRAIRSVLGMDEPPALTEEGHSTPQDVKPVLYYDMNPTMRMIGRGTWYLSVLKDGKYADVFREVMQARGKETSLDAALDFYALGMICGIREERKRRKDKGSLVNALDGLKTEKAVQAAAVFINRLAMKEGMQK